MYLAIQDDTKRPAHEKILEAMSAYTRRFGEPATVVLCNTLDQPLERLGVKVVPVPWAQRHVFYIGQGEP